MKRYRLQGTCEEGLSWNGSFWYNTYWKEVRYMELWDLYDAQQKPVNKLQMRGKPIPDGCYHIVVFIWTFTYDGQLLLTKRDACKPGGLLWEVTGGSVLHGESSKEGAQRELYEETGIQCNQHQLHKLHRKLKGQGIYDHYLLQYPVELDKLQLQEKETIDAMLADQATFEEMMRVHIITHPLQLWYHELKDQLAVYFQTNK